MNNNLSQQEADFLAGLTELTLKTGVVIDGCGCCGSPYLLSNAEDLARGNRYGYVRGQVMWSTESEFDK